VVELTAKEWAALSPAGKSAGTSWAVPVKAVEKVLRCCYPPTPHWRLEDAKLVSASLQARVVAATPREVRVALSGKLELIHPYKGKPTDPKVTARLRGVLRYDPAKKKVTSLLLASQEGRYVWYWEGKPQTVKVSVAVESVR
jgi:hypothetical protein